MSTKRKTLKQKRVSELRRSKQASENNISSSTTAPMYSFTGTSTPSQSVPTPKATLFTYDLKDIKNSLLVSGFLLLANIVIFILVKNNVISIALLGL